MTDEDLRWAMVFHFSSLLDVSILRCMLPGRDPI
jgi:hypothetical protein